MSDGHSHDDHGHHHGHAHDRGPRAMLRYLRHAGTLWSSEVNDALVDLIDPTPSEHIADIGAGVGAGVAVAARRAAHVWAVEPTPYMQRILRLRIRLLRLSATVVDGAAEATGLADGSVDAVMAVNTMHHWVSVEVAAGELARIMRPGARLVLADEDFDDPAHPDHEKWGSANHGDGIDDHGSHHHFDMVDAERMGELLTTSGLEVTTAGKVNLAGRPTIMVRATKSA